jgi:hypothetical protein
MVVELAPGTTTETGLRILAEWDQGYYPAAPRSPMPNSLPCPSIGTTGMESGTTTSRRPSSANRPGRPNSHFSGPNRSGGPFDSRRIAVVDRNAHRSPSRNSRYMAARLGGRPKAR